MHFPTGKVAESDAGLPSDKVSTENIQLFLNLYCLYWNDWIISFGYSVGNGNSDEHRTKY